MKSLAFITPWKWLAQVGILIVILLETACGVTITAPSHYIAFTGEGIEVTYSNMTLSDPVIEVVDVTTNQVISSSSLPKGFPNAETYITCGGIDYAGIFRVRIMDKKEKKVVAETDDIEVVWPHIVLQIPRELETLTGSVKLNFEIRDKVECNSIRPDTKYTIKLVRYDNPEDLSLVQVVHKVNMSTFNNLALDSNAISMNCALFDQAGIYEIHFLSNQGQPDPIAISNRMSVTWSTMYAVTTLEEHILPCDEYFVVAYQQPRCAGSEDKIRLYEKQHSTDSLAGPSSMNYITEHRAVKGDITVKFRCDIFQDEIVEYCFKYVSFASSGLLHEHDTKCVPTKFSPGIAVDGGWSPWSQWGSCTSSCEGGTRSRYRTCDNPVPQYTGKMCEGKAFEPEVCGSKCAVPTTLSPLKSFTTDPECICGCNYREARGSIVSSSVCKGSSIWKIYAAEGSVIQLTFLYYNIRRSNYGTPLQIRDGDSLRDSLLFNEFSGSTLPAPILSTQNKMLIEFTSPQQGSTGEYNAPDEGFAASYISFVMAGPGVTDSQDSTIWSSTILVIAVLLFVAILVAVVGFICYHRYNIRKKEKERLQMANQALLVNGEAPPTSPSHSQSISSVKGSTNISFGDPASSPTRKSGKKRDYVLPKSSPGSPTKLKDVKLKHKRPRSPTKSKGAKGVGSPPQSPHKHKVGVMPTVYSSPRSTHKENSNTIDPSGQTPTSVYSISSHGYIPVSTLGSPANPPRAAIGNQPTSTGSPLATRGDTRNKSFLSAISKPAAPLAGHEELSPTTPKDLPPSYSSYFDNSSQLPYSGRPNQEAIPMDAYYSARNKPDTYELGEITETGMYSPHTKRRLAKSPQDVPEKRPPVEGRDSLTRKKADEQHPVYESMQSGNKGMVTRPDIHHNANYTVPGSHTRPEIKPLPLRSIQRPDGQSPDNNNKEDSNSKTPGSQVSSELSPIFKKEPLFPESKSNSTMDLDMPGDNDFEYDDYVPDLPGSYFSMDPHAYTLTWSQQSQPKWGGAGAGQKAANNQKNNGSSMC